MFKPETADETESHQTSDHSSFSVFSWSWVIQKIKHCSCAIKCGLQTINGQVFHIFVLSVSYLQTYLKLSKSSLFVLSMNLERRTSPNLYCGWTSLLIVLKRNVFFKPTSKVEQRDWHWSSSSPPCPPPLPKILWRRSQGWPGCRWCPAPQRQETWCRLRWSHPPFRKANNIFTFNQTYFVNLPSSKVCKRHPAQRNV